MLYSKITHGWVEQIYDFDGNCLGQKFMADDSKQIERRAYRQKEDGPMQPGQLEHDQIIEHPEDLQFIDEKERYCDFTMVQPAEMGLIPRK